MPEARSGCRFVGPGSHRTSSGVRFALRDLSRHIVPMSLSLIVGMLISESDITLCAAEEPSASDESTSTQFTAAQIEFFESRIRPLLARRCYECHSSKSRTLKAGLLLDSRSAILKGGDSGRAINLEKPEESLLIEAVRFQSYEMPPDGKLKDQEIAWLVTWIEMGAPWPDNETAISVSSGRQELDWNELRNSHWAWKPVTRPEPPRNEVDAHPIDAFVREKLTKVGLRMSPVAESQVLIRRLYLDLIGFPPTPEQTRRFEHESETNPAKALKTAIDELLASEHYGERWGRHWLDVARYSDGYGGFLDNAGLSEAWRYRDWVVQALNSDLPYDDFIRLQIAGDLINDSNDGAVATGFFALGPTYRSDGGDPEARAQAQSETLDDRLDTLGRGIMGLTIACARCHDHKFDPIPQIDYYSLAGVFNNSAVQQFPLVSDEVVQAYNDAQKAIRDQQAKIQTLQKTARNEKRKLTDNEQRRIKEWNAELADMRKSAPPMYAFAHALRDSGKADMRVALRGNLLKPGNVAPRQFLRVLDSGERHPLNDGSGRLQLASAVASAENPLTARVIVNRIWLHHFGKALVRSPGNFGTLGQKPTHPELLDWLAATLIDNGWSIKSLHRQILTSSTWQQSSRINDQAFSIDGDNELIWRMNPRRMDAESWRDSLLAVTGELDKSIGGQPIDNITKSNRRTLYAKVSRNGDRFPSDEFLRLFDFPSMRATIASRPTSIVPQQFLFMMNSEFMVDRAKALVARLDKTNHTPPSAEEQIDLAYQLLFGRSPSDDEVELGLDFVTSPASESRSGHDLPRWVQYAQVLLSSNEFMFVR